MTKNKNFSREKSNRIVLFADLRDSTDILMDFEQGIYKKAGEQTDADFTYEKFIFDLHETIYKELYLGHESTFAELYGDGVIGVFPEDNSKYILENIYRLSTRMRAYNDNPQVGSLRPRIDIGIGITFGKVNFVYFPLDERNHPVGQCLHEASRIVSVSKFYDARILISHRFFNYIEGFLNLDQRFSYRFIDRVILKGFRESITLFELLMDSDPRFEIKKRCIPEYSEAYSLYCKRNWEEAKRIFSNIYEEYGLGIGDVMASRCIFLASHPPGSDWNGIWELKDK